MLQDVWALISAWARPLGILAIFFGPRILGYAVRYLRGGHAHHSHLPRPPPTPPLSRTAKTILALHALYAFSALLSPPFDVFTSHSLSTACPKEALRAAVLSDVGLDPRTPAPAPEDIATSEAPAIETLLARLALPESRASYARWGHAAFVPCSWCRDDTDYAAAAAPSILAPYLSQLLLLGLLSFAAVSGAGARLRADKWAALAGWGTLALAATEYAVRWSWDVTPPRDKSDTITLSSLVGVVRPFALFGVTAAYLLAPARLSQKAATQAATVSALEAALNASRLTSLAHGAVARSPALARHAFERGQLRARAEAGAKKDEAVLAAAQGAGLFAGADHVPQSREGARAWVTGEWRKVVKSDD
ncbi:hypothetical protein Q8F55_005266 [Vanrija albida]|uniref:Integral membrane protein n=1 Tax=Vanrija albida TaxID=181172 RepID=A0ABR3Q151_9TREE